MADRDLRYSCFGLKSPFFQRFNNVKGVVICLCLCNFSHCFVTQGLPGVLISTLETRFGLSSSQSSWIASAYEVATIPVLFILSFFGHRIHKPRVISFGMFLVSLGTIIFVLPHFIMPSYNPMLKEGPDNLCRNRTDDEMCEAGAENNNQQGDILPYALLLFGRVLHGAGCTPVFTLSVTYMDDILERKMFSLMIGAFYSMAVLGPGLGIMGGGSFLNIYTDFPADPPPGLTTASAHWIGAWWLPFLIGGVLCFIMAIPTAGFPRDLPGAAEMRACRKSEAHGAGSTEDQTKIDAKTILRGLLRNPPFLLITGFLACDNFTILGFQAFGPKVVELLFSVDKSIAGAVLGGVLLPAGLLGTLVGGAVIEKFRLNCKQIIRIEAALTVGVIISFFPLFANCSKVRFAGVSYPYDSQPDVLGYIDAPCNSDCRCDGLPFEPVCSHDNVKFYSPCHAGCTLRTDFSNITEYFNCSCITHPSDPIIADATSEGCILNSCPERNLFLCSFFLCTTLMFMCDSMNTSATVRLIKHNEKDMAVPIQWIIFCSFGTMPGPLAFGAVLDNACSLWSWICGDSGACLLYDNWTLGANLFFLVGGVKLASLIFIGAAMVVYNPEKSGMDPSVSVSEFEEEEEEEESEMMNMGTVSRVMMSFDASLTGRTSGLRIGSRGSAGRL